MAVSTRWTTAAMRVRSAVVGGGGSGYCVWVLLADGRSSSAVPVEVLEILGGTTRAERADGGGDEFGTVEAFLSPDGPGDDAGEDAGGLARLRAPQQAGGFAVDAVLQAIHVQCPCSGRARSLCAIVLCAELRAPCVPKR